MNKTEEWIKAKKAERKEESKDIILQLREMQKENQKLLTKLLRNIDKI